MLLIPDGEAPTEDVQPKWQFIWQSIKRFDGREVLFEEFVPHDVFDDIDLCGQPKVPDFNIVDGIVVPALLKPKVRDQAKLLSWAFIKGGNGQKRNVATPAQQTNKKAKTGGTNLVKPSEAAGLDEDEDSESPKEIVKVAFFCCFDPKDLHQSPLSVPVVVDKDLETVKTSQAVHLPRNAGRTTENRSWRRYKSASAKRYKAAFKAAEAVYILRQIKVAETLALHRAQVMEGDLERYLQELLGSTSQSDVVKSLQYFQDSTDSPRAKEIAKSFLNSYKIFQREVPLKEPFEDLLGFTKALIEYGDYSTSKIGSLPPPTPFKRPTLLFLMMLHPSYEKLDEDAKKAQSALQYIEEKFTNYMKSPMYKGWFWHLMMSKNIFGSTIPFDTKSPNAERISPHMQSLWEQLGFLDKSKFSKPESRVSKTSKVISKFSTSGEALGRANQLIAEDGFESEMYDSVKPYLKSPMQELLALPKDALAVKCKVGPS